MRKECSKCADTAALRLPECLGLSERPFPLFKACGLNPPGEALESMYPFEFGAGLMEHFTCTILYLFPSQNILLFENRENSIHHELVIKSS
jgi:hypothetical protein